MLNWTLASLGSLLLVVVSTTPVDLSRSFEENQFTPVRQTADASKLDASTIKEVYNSLENMLLHRAPGVPIKIKIEKPTIPTVKKACEFRIGGMCLTEDLDRQADIYYFLKSADSPGRRRRSAASSDQNRKR